MPTVVTGEQAGAQVLDIIQIMADNYGYSENNTRFKNIITRRCNQAIRQIYMREPRLRVFRVFGGACTIKAGVADYDVRKTEENGGFGWTGCSMVEQLIFNTIDNRPLERLEPEQYRERSELLATQGPPMSWVSLKPWVVRITPTPDMDVTGVGDYWTELSSLVNPTDLLDWPRSLDELILAGVDALTAQVRLRERPQAVAPFWGRFESMLMDLVINEKTKQTRPQEGQTSRHMRSRRTIPADNSTDVRYWR